MISIINQYINSIYGCKKLVNCKLRVSLQSGRYLTEEKGGWYPDCPVVIDQHHCEGVSDNIYSGGAHPSPGPGTTVWHWLGHCSHPAGGDRRKKKVKLLQTFTIYNFLVVNETFQESNSIYLAKIMDKKCHKITVCQRSTVYFPKIFVETLNFLREKINFYLLYV